MSRQSMSFVVTKDVFCCDKHIFVVRNTCLLRQISFVATKTILVAALASDKYALLDYHRDS